MVLFAWGERGFGRNPPSLKSVAIISENARIQVWKPVSFFWILSFLRFRIRCPSIFQSRSFGFPPWIFDSSSPRTVTSFPKKRLPNPRRIRPRVPKCSGFAARRTTFPIPWISSTRVLASFPRLRDRSGFSYSTIPGSFLPAYTSRTRSLPTGTAFGAKSPERFFSFAKCRRKKAD